MINNEYQRRIYKIDLNKSSFNEIKSIKMNTQSITLELGYHLHLLPYIIISFTPSSIIYTSTLTSLIIIA